MGYRNPWYYVAYLLYTPWRGCTMRRFCIDILPQVPQRSRPLMRLWRLPAWRAVVAVQVWHDRKL